MVRLQDINFQELLNEARRPCLLPVSVSDDPWFPPSSSSTIPREYESWAKSRFSTGFDNDLIRLDSIHDSVHDRKKSKRFKRSCESFLPFFWRTQTWTLFYQITDSHEKLLSHHWIFDIVVLGYNIIFQRFLDSMPPLHRCMLNQGWKTGFFAKKC